MDALFAALKGRRTARHGVLPPESRNDIGAPPRGRPPVSRDGDPHGSATTVERTIGVHLRSSAVEIPSTAGHGLLPSFSSRPLDGARRVHRPAPRPGFVQRTLLGGTALGLGLSVAPPVAAGHGVLPSFSRRAG
jgi:hypothetical protein